MIELSRNLFGSLFVELIVVIIAIFVRDDKRKIAAVLAIGTALAGLIAISPQITTFLNSIPSPMSLPTSVVSSPTFVSNMSNVQIRLITGDDGTEDKPIITLNGKGQNVFAYVIDTPLRPNTTQEFTFSVPLNFCDIDGFYIDKPAGNNSDDLWILNEVIIYINNIQVWDDFSLTSFNPIDSTPTGPFHSNPNGGWNETENYKKMCGG